MMCDARLFAPQVATLERSRDVIVPPLTGAQTVPDLARGILAAAPPRFALGGLSMGGIVAMEMTAQAPDRVERLMLMDTNPKSETPEVRARRGPQVDKVRAGGLRTVMAEEMKPNYLSDGPKRAEILDLCMAMALGLGPQVFIDQSLALRDRPDQCNALTSFDLPTLILCGEADALCPLDRHELMRDLIPGARLTVIADAGHLPTLEQPAATSAAMANWLA